MGSVFVVHLSMLDAVQDAAPVPQGPKPTTAGLLPGMNGYVWQPKPMWLKSLRKSQKRSRHQSQVRLRPTA
jgi:hypothetical protein